LEDLLFDWLLFQFERIQKEFSLDHGRALNSGTIQNNSILENKIFIENLSISSISMSLTLHASIKVF